MFHPGQIIRNARLWIQCWRTGVVRERGYATVPEVLALAAAAFLAATLVVLNTAGSARFLGPLTLILIFLGGFRLLKIGVLSGGWLVAMREIARDGRNHRGPGCPK